MTFVYGYTYVEKAGRRYRPDHFFILENRGLSPMVCPQSESDPIDFALIQMLRLK